MTATAKILVAEDDPILRSLTCQVLQAAGYETLGAQDGEEALKMTHTHRPDLILLDVNMPRMDGFEALRRIRTDPDLAFTFVIIVSGSRTDTDSQVHGLETGADGYLVRPLSNRELVARVQSLLRLKAAEDAVRAKEKQLHDLVASNIDGMLVVDGDGHALFANPAACDLLARSPDTIIGQHIGILLTAGEHTELDLLRPDGNRRVVELRVTPIEWEGRPAHLAALRDITRRKQVEDEIRQLNAALETRVEERTRALRAAQEQLVRREKLAMLGQLAGSVGHELRNPLGVISNAVYFLKLIQPQAETKVQKYLNMIEAETRAADKIITDLLNFARIKSAKPEVISVPRLVEQVLARYPAPAEVRVVLDFPPDLPLVTADALHLEHALGNLVLNACQAMPDGGELVIRGLGAGDWGAGTGDGEQPSAVGGQPSAVGGQPSYVTISVRDTGVGIQPENLSKLFEPLYTTKAKGIGLGLPVTKELIEANGGRIEVASEPGAGATFCVYLPVHKAPLA